MSEVVHPAQHEFWRPPAAGTQHEATARLRSPDMEEACEGCGTEFMVGARFCYSCGATREMRSSSTPANWARYLEFHAIKEGLGLPVASFIAFLAGLGCLFAALAVGFIYSVQNFADFQAIQLWRLEWLLGAVAAFVAGILLKHVTPNGQ